MAYLQYLAVLALVSPVPSADPSIGFSAKLTSKTTQLKGYMKAQCNVKHDLCKSDLATISRTILNIESVNHLSQTQSDHTYLDI